ncbi:VasL domain-containing protein [Aeromonas molluscorum]|uniref:VasL domain-containing protein n=1 Tax=Aeromonas molluscorum TaxID=271417 RepID=UPI003F1DC0C1
MPAALSYDDIRQARIVLGEQTLQNMESDSAARYQNQLTRLEQTSPLYWYRYGEGLRNSLSMLISTRWRSRRWTSSGRRSLAVSRGMSSACPPTWMPAPGWMPCSITLLELERQRKTVTISYLKSRLYEIQKDLLVEVPLEARLSDVEGEGGQVPPAQLKSMEDELKSLTVRLYQLQQLAQRQDDGVLPPG